MSGCRACGGSRLDPVIDLGLQPPSNAYLDSPSSPETLYPLRAAVCLDCHLMQVDYDVPPGDMFNEHYAYFSANSKEWLAHTQAYAEMAVEKFGLKPDKSVVYEIGGNDGHLLKHFKGKVLRAVNIEPSASVAAAAREAGVETWCEFWGEKQMWADLIIANNVMAHTPDLQGFVKALSTNLKPHGIITIEFPSALELLQNGEFDTIYHEHYSYLSLTALEPLFARYGLHVYDVEKLPTHGGSLRLYVGKFQTPTPAVAEIRLEEYPLRLPHIYDTFARRAEWCKTEFLNFLTRNRGQIVAYGAAAKGNTFLNYCGVNSDQIAYVADTTPAKQGKFLPGSHIPVVPEWRMIDDDPRIILILAWNWRHEIIEKLRPRLQVPMFVTAIPKLEIS